jgi:hypothetical protein
MEWNKLILKKYDKFDCVFLQKENQYFIAKNNNGIKKEKKMLNEYILTIVNRYIEREY